MVQGGNYYSFKGKGLVL